jgi:Transposase
VRGSPAIRTYPVLGGVCPNSRRPEWARRQAAPSRKVLIGEIAAAKRKNDKIDAGKIADCLRSDFLPECHMASTEIRDRRRTLRYRNLVLRQEMQMKNRVSGLLMETLR